MVLDFCPFGCLLSSFSAAFGRFPSFWLPFVFSLAALLGPLLPPQSLKHWFWNLWFWTSVLLAAFCLPFRLLLVDFRPFWLPFVFSLAALLGPLLFLQSLKNWFWNLWFWISVLLAAFCLPFRLLFVDIRPFGCLLSSFSAAFCRIPFFWLPFVFSLAAFWARCFLRGPLNIGFEIYGFGFLCGSVAQNDHFGSFFFKIWKKPRTKRSFWKLLLWNLEEASRKTIILEASSLKFGGSLAQNDHFESFFSEIWRKPRTKRSFWKLLFWNLEETSRKTILLEASPLEFKGSLVRNDHFGSFFFKIWRKPRAKRSFWKLLF